MNVYSQIDLFIDIAEVWNIYSATCYIQDNIQKWLLQSNKYYWNFRMIIVANSASFLKSFILVVDIRFKHQVHVMTKTYASAKSYHVIPIEIIGVSLQLIWSCKLSFKVILEERICIPTFWRVCCLSLIIATEMHKVTINDNYLYQLFMLCVKPWIQANTQHSPYL